MGQALKKETETEMSDKELLEKIYGEMHNIADQKVKDQGKVLTQGKALVMFCISLFLPLLGGLVYYFQDQAATTERINLVEKRSIEKMGKIETEIATVKGKVDVVKVTVEQTQKDMEFLKKNLSDFLSNKSGSKKNEMSFNKSKFALQ